MPTRLVSVVIDSADPPRLARWWAEALGWPLSYEDDDESDVAPPEGEPGVELVFVWVSDPKTTRNRVRLHVAGTPGLTDRLLAAGATRSGDDLLDPDGNEFRVVDPEPGTGALAAIVQDTLDPPALAPFWAAASGWAVALEDPAATSLRAPDGRGPLLVLSRTDVAHVVKNRLHLDVAPYEVDDQAEEVARVSALGAVPAEVGQSDAPPDYVVNWVVLADPEGNEFCILSPRGSVDRP